MNCTLLLHSTTGNTRLLAQLARQILERQGHTCTLVDILERPEPPDLEATELLLVAASAIHLAVHAAPAAGALDSRTPTCDATFSLDAVD